MASNIATLQAKLIADTSQFLRELKRAESALGGVGKGFKLLSMAASPLKMVGSLLSSVAGGLLRIGQIAAGILLAELFRKGAQAIQWFLKTAMDATEVMQRLNIQIQTLAARELSKSIDASLNQAITWRKMGADGETVTFNVLKLREAVEKYGDVILDVNPELKNLINSNKDFATVSIDVAKKWMSTSDVFEQSEATARGFINQLKRIAIISPFTVATTNTMFRLASALGFTQQQSVTVTKGMLDVAAGLGLTDEAAQRLVLNFAQIRSQGKLTQRDIREMSLTGFQMADVFDEMNRTLGTSIKTNTDFNDALKKGQFTWEEFVNSFASMADREFGESAKRMAFTIGGLKSTFKDVFLTTIPEILMPAAEIFGKFAEEAVDGLMDLVASGDLERIGEELGTNLEIWIGHIQTFKLRLDEAGIVTALEGLSQVGGLPPVVAGSLNTLADTLAEIQGLKDVFHLIESVGAGSFDSDARESLGGSGKGVTEMPQIPVQDIMPEDSALSGPIEGILELWQKLRDWWDENGGVIKAAVLTLGVVLGGMFKGAADALGPSLAALWESFKNLAEKVPWEALLTILGAIAVVLGTVLFAAFMAVVGIVQGVIDGISTFFDTVAALFDIFTEIWDNFKSVLTGDMSIIDFFAALAPQIVSIVTTGLGGLGEIALSMLSGFLDGMASVWNGVADAIGLEHIPMLGTVISEGLHGIMERLKEWFGEKVPELVSAGKDFINGLWEGMKSIWGKVEGWLQGVIEDLPEGIKKILGIHSPSSVMIDIGTNIIGGLAAGIGSDDPGDRLKRSFSLKELNTSLYTKMSASLRERQQGPSAGKATQTIAKVTAQAATQAAQTAASVAAGTTAEVSSMMAAFTAASTNRQLASEAQTRGALVTKLEEVVFAIQAQGNAGRTASAISEALQMADF